MARRKKPSRRKGKESSFKEQLLRMVKTPWEIEILRESAKISDTCVGVVERELRKKDMTEKQLAAAVDRNIRRQGAKLAFPTIAISGKRAIFIHGKPTNARLRGLGYVDCGAKYKGYCTDITIPFVKGRIGTRQQKIFDATKEGFERLRLVPKVGMPCWKGQDRFESFLHSKGYGVRHSLGHGIGLEIHELPSITKPRRGKRMRPSRKKLWGKLREIKFEAGQAFTIEPGIYVRGVGGCRYENDFLMTRKGPVQITRSRPVIIKD